MESASQASAIRAQSRNARFYVDTDREEYITNSSTYVSPPVFAFLLDVLRIRRLRVKLPEFKINLNVGRMLFIG